MVKKYYAIRKGRKTGIFTDHWDDVKKLVNGYSKAEYKGFPTLEEAERYMGSADKELVPLDGKTIDDYKFELPLEDLTEKNPLIQPIDSLLIGGDDVEIKKEETRSFKSLKDIKELKNNSFTHKSPLNFGSLPTKSKSNQIRNENFVWNEDTFDYSGLVIFTDGSVEYANGSANKGFKPTGTSFGIVILQDGKVIKLGSKAFNDSFNDKRNVIGEIRGVLSALQYANKLGVKKVKICFDYIGVALWIDDFEGVKKWKSKQSMTESYVKMFKQLTKNMEVEFVKVPAHSNVKYNELADELAKQSFKGDEYLKSMNSKYNI